MAKQLSKGKKSLDAKTMTDVEYVHEFECPFRQFKDSELGFELWGKNFQEMHQINTSLSTLPIMEEVWNDPQLQPLQKTARYNLAGWMRAKEFAVTNWEADVSLFEPSKPNEDEKLCMKDLVVGYGNLLHKSMFVRQVLSYCYLIERSAVKQVQHQNEHFTFSFTQDLEWHPKYQIYSPAMKAGGGALHAPQISKDGCYMVRLFYLGMWRCVWVDDRVPYDSNNEPLLPFNWITCNNRSKTSIKSASTSQNPGTTPSTVVLWPLLLCKALLKLFSPEQTTNDDIKDRDPNIEQDIEDEDLHQFDIMLCLTGYVKTKVKNENIGFLKLWETLISELDLFEWSENENQNITNVTNKKSSTTNTKKVTPRSLNTKNDTVVVVDLSDTEDVPSYELAGLTPAHAFPCLINMARDLPLKKPPPEPELAPWKKFRWYEWAKLHGIYEPYTCPRTKYLQVCGLMRMSYATHMLDVQSTETICENFRIEMSALDSLRRKTDSQKITLKALFPEDGIWVLFRKLISHIESINFYYNPLSNSCQSIGTALKSSVSTIKNNRNVPIYLMIDTAADVGIIKMCFTVMTKNILLCDEKSITDFLPLIHPGFLLMEQFDWLSADDIKLSGKKNIEVLAFMKTDGTCSIEIKLSPGRYNFRLWVESLTPWHLFIMCASNTIVADRTHAIANAALHSPWATKNLSSFELTFKNWTSTADNIHNLALRTEFYRSYRPDKPWEIEKIGYPPSSIHWMFRFAIQEYLSSYLEPDDFQEACKVLRVLFLDLQFGKMKLPEVSIQLSTSTVPPYEPSGQSYNYPNGTDLISESMILTLDHYACIIQKWWRRFRVKLLLKSHFELEADENFEKIKRAGFGNINIISKLFNTMFDLFEGTKQLFTFGNGLVGHCKVYSFSGVYSVLSADQTWVPLALGIFFCHRQIRIQFSIDSSASTNWIVMFDNDTLKEIRIGNRAKQTYVCKPNTAGYTLYSHGRLNNNKLEEIPWEMHILCSDAAFHICNNEWPNCIERPLSDCKLYVMEDFYWPNVNNILIRVIVKVLQDTFITILCNTTHDQLPIKIDLIELESDKRLESRIGFGEYFWTHIKLDHLEVLEPKQDENLSPNKNKSLLNAKKGINKGVEPNKILSSPAIRPTFYAIEMSAPEGWALTIPQWARVIELRTFYYEQNPKQMDPKIKGEVKSNRTSIRNESNLQFDVAPQDIKCCVQVSIPKENTSEVYLDDYRLTSWWKQATVWDKPSRKEKGIDIRAKFMEQYIITPDHLNEESSPLPSAQPNTPDSEYDEPDRNTLDSRGDMNETFLQLPSLFKFHFVPVQLIQPPEDDRPKHVDYFDLDEDEFFEARIKVNYLQQIWLKLAYQQRQRAAWQENIMEWLQKRRELLADQ